MPNWFHQPLAAPSPIPKHLAQFRIFITGIQGLIGWNLYTDYQKRAAVFGFSKTKRPAIGEWYEGLLEDYRHVRDILKRVDPDIVIHTQAMCNLDLCEQKPQKTHRVNVEATEKLIGSLDHRRHRLVYVSSEHVFSGRKGRYTETEPPDPISVYGRTRVLAEKLVAAFPRSLILRPGLAIGKSLQGHIGPQDWLRSRIQKNLPASYFTDEIRSPLWIKDLVSGIQLLIEKEYTGIYHLGGERSYSRYEIAKILQKGWGVEADIRSKKTADDRVVPRVRDCSIDSQKAGRAGWPIPRFP